MSLKSKFRKRLPWLKPVRPNLVSYTRRLPFDGDAAVHIAIVGSERLGLAGQGKIRPERYFPKFEYGAIKAGATVDFYQTPSSFIRSLHMHQDRPLAVIFVYNEERIKDYPSEAAIQLLEQRPYTIVYNSPEIARKIAEKPVTNRILTDAGIDVPRMSSRADAPLFSNTITGSMQPTNIVARGSPVDPARYNTELIDTRVEVDGHEYFILLRAMCVGCRVLEVLARCRPVEDHSPNVHGVDTPLDAIILNCIHNQHVQPRVDEIRSLCERLGSTLGPGFYAHDILLSRDGRLPICEVGFKFDAASFTDHLWPISSELDFMRDAFLYNLAEEAARVVAETAKNE